MKKLMIQALVCVPLLFLACQQSGESEYASPKQMELDQQYEQTSPTETQELTEQTETTEPTKTEQSAEIQRKLIKMGRVEFETPSIDSTRKTVLRAVQEMGAYVSSDRAYKSNDRITNVIEIRVPAEKFDAFLAAVTEGVERLESKSISVRDVTEEYLDIQARIKTKKELEARYRQLMSRANTVSEMLEIEKQMGELRAEIESIEGRLKYLENRVAFSTLTVEFYQKTQSGPDFGGKFGQGFRNGWNNLIWFFVGLANIWPFILIAVGMFFGLRFFFRRK